MRRYMPFLAALAMGAVSTTAMAAGTHAVTAPDWGARTGTTMLTAPDDSGVLTNTAVVETFDATLGQTFEIERAIVDRAQQVFGRTAVFESAEELPAAIDDAIVPGNMLPASTPTEAVPAELGDLPKLVDNSRWVAAGNHLVEVTPDNRIVMVVYDALP